MGEFSFNIHRQLYNGRYNCEDSTLLSVVVPIYNESATLNHLLNKLFKEKTSKEIILVDDGSDDRTLEVMESWLETVPELNAQTFRIVLLCHNRNHGKGAAFRSGLSVACGRYTLPQDADLEVSPTEFPRLLEPLESKRAEFVVGARIPRANGRFSFHRWGVMVLNSLVRILYGYRMSDSACCFKVLKTSDLRRMNLRCERFEFCAEVISKASRMGLAMAEVEVDYWPRSADEGKKLRFFKDGLRAIATLLWYRSWRPPSARSDGSSYFR